MKAAVCAGGVIELREWRDPAPGPGELPPAAVMPLAVPRAAVTPSARRASSEARSQRGAEPG